MSKQQNLDDKINKLGLRTAILVVVLGGVSVFFPLDAPQGAFGDRMIWYSHNLTAFVMGWAVQMIAMLVLSGFFATIAWTARGSHPISSFLAGTALLISVMCFLIPKFIAIWSIPQMVEASTRMSHDAALAGQLFQLLHPSLSFSLFTSFDYLGFGCMPFLACFWWPRFIGYRLMQKSPLEHSAYLACFITLCFLASCLAALPRKKLVTTPTFCFCSCLFRSSPWGSISEPK